MASAPRRSQEEPSDDSDGEPWDPIADFRRQTRVKAEIIFEHQAEKFSDITKPPKLWCLAADLIRKTIFVREWCKAQEWQLQTRNTELREALHEHEVEAEHALLDPPEVFLERMIALLGKLV